MRRPLRLLAGALAAFLASCSPFSVDALADTRVKSLCHFAYGCCSPVERDRFLLFTFEDEQKCVSEAEEDADFGVLFTIDQEARDAVARDTATYDADAAERCSKKSFDAVNACKSEELFTKGGSIDFDKVFILVDSADLECVQLGLRDFTRGTVKDGDPCVSNFDCADFGACVVGDDTITTSGTCRAPKKAGDVCAVDADCQAGLRCLESACTKVEPKADGEPCDVDSDCTSGSCELGIVDGTCAFSGAACTQQEECGADDFCDGTFVDTCAATATVTVDICDGL